MRFEHDISHIIYYYKYFYWVKVIFCFKKWWIINYICSKVIIAICINMCINFLFHAYFSNYFFSLSFILLYLSHPMHLRNNASYEKTVLSYITAAMLETQKLLQAK